MASAIHRPNNNNNNNIQMFGLRNHNKTLCNTYRLDSTNHIDCIAQPQQQQQNQPVPHNNRPNNTTSRSVSWNNSGSNLAFASSCSTVRLWDIEIANSTSASTTTTTSNNNASQSNTVSTTQLIGKEVLTITGHNGPVLKVRFHSIDNNILCSSGTDSTILLWDIRNASQRSIGKIDIQYNTSAISVEWAHKNCINTNILQVTERDNTIYIYDVRKLSNPSSTKNNKSSNNTNTSNFGSNNSALCKYIMKTNIVETCLFTPDGNNIITGSTYRGEGIGELRIFPWMLTKKQQNDNIINNKNINNIKDSSTDYVTSISNIDHFDDNDTNMNTTNKLSNTTSTTNTTLTPAKKYSANAGPIYTMSYSNNGQYLATGGSDATVCIFDVNSMCCIKSITRRTKFIRSVTFSSNNNILAISSEEDTIDITNVQTGELIGLANFNTTSTTNNNNNNNNNTRNNRGGGEGAEEITFHPNKENYLLACARTDTVPTQTAPVTILKMNINSNTSS